jgi:hypothetical protein
MRNRNFTALASLILSLVFFATSMSLAFQGPAAINNPDTAALNAADEILKTVSRLRQLEIKHAVKRDFKTKDQIEQSVIRDLDENTSPEEFEATRKTLIKLGLVKNDFRLRDYIVQLLREQVAGYYEPKTKEFYLAAWLPLSDQKRVIAHELMHALQDQHFDLRRFERWPKGDSDAELAAHALVEGEATLVMIQYELEQSGFRLDLNISLTNLMLENDGAEDKQYPIMANAPKVLRENLQFPYIYGAGFAQAVLRKGSWPLVNEAYARLPVSTEQILHPEKFLNPDNPTEVKLADALAVLGKGWRQADSDINGEFGYRVLLSEFISKSAAQAAGAGWDGDRYALYENPRTGDVLLVQYTTWDTPGDAQEFLKAYAQRTERRYNIGTPKNTQQQSLTYETGEGIVAVELRGSDVLIIEGAQSREHLAKLMERMWQSEKRERQGAMSKPARN